MQGQPARFDRYELLAALGAGGMGEVVKARAQGPHGFEKVVAIKRIRAEWAAEEAMADRFVREARIAARLQHANIVQVFDFGRHGDELFIVMEYVDGQSLDAILAALRSQGKRPTLAQCLQVGLDVSRALDYAHNLTDEDGAADGIVHRDVSPANVLVSRQGLVKLTDFGIAALASQQGRTSLIAGKPLYMSPEQLRGDPLDGRADLFAVGIVLYEMLTAERPWKGIVDAGAEATLSSMGYVPPSRCVPGIANDIDALLERLLTPDRRGRMSSARELTKEILSLSYRCQIVLDPTELAPLVVGGVSEAHAPTVPQYISKIQTLVATGVSPDGVTLLKTEDDPPLVAAAPSRGVPAWVWAVSAIAVLLSGVAAAWMVIRTDAGPDGPSRTSAQAPSLAAEAPDRASREGTEAEEGAEAPGAEPPVAVATIDTPPPEPTGEPVGPVEPSDPPDGTLGAMPEPPRAGRAARAIGRRPPRTSEAHPPRATGGSGELDVFSRPWAEIWIDGVRQTENAPARGLRVSAGTHRVRLVNPVLGLSAERTVVVADGGHAQVRVIFEQPSE